jgi:centromere protein C
MSDQRNSKTGLTLPENPRDEHGIEDLNGIFSSPEKSPVKRVLRNGNTTLTSDEMELAQSMIVEKCTVVLNSKLTTGKQALYQNPPLPSPPADYFDPRR